MACLATLRAETACEVLTAVDADMSSIVGNTVNCPLLLTTIKLQIKGFDSAAQSILFDGFRRLGLTLKDFLEGIGHSLSDRFSQLQQFAPFLFPGKAE